MQSPPFKIKSVAVFDSGFGGLTVLKELQRELPTVPFIYLGDTARLPYGTKSKETIIRYTLECCSFLAAQNAQLIVIACNTATALALPDVQKQIAVPLIGVIDPVIESIVTTSPSARIGILGTKATIQSGVYDEKITKLLPHAKITAISAPLLVSLVEEGFIDHPLTHLAIEEYTKPLLQASVDTVILGCTHFPLLKPLFEKILGPSIQVVDPALPCTAHIKKLIPPPVFAPLPSRFYVTDDPEKFQHLAPRFLRRPIAEVHHCILKTDYIH